MTGCDYIAEFLSRRGLLDVFGYQGGAVTPLIDAMVRGGINYHQCLHEQASGFAADAYSRITGKCGVVVVTNGPGVTNAVSAIANAHLDSVPCLFLLGQVNVRDIKCGASRQNGFQEVDGVSIVKSITKYAHRVESAYELGRVLAKAVDCACSGRKGATCVEIPMNVLFEQANVPQLEPAHDMAPLAENEIAPEIKNVAQALVNAKRPVFVVGGGVRSCGAGEAISDFANRYRIPVVKTLNGLDAVAVENDAGMSGTYGTVAANMAVDRADLVVALGTRLSTRQICKYPSKFAPKAQKFLVDVSPEEAGVLPADIRIVKMDVLDFATRLNRLELPVFDVWSAEVAAWENDYWTSACDNGEPDPVRIVAELSKAAPADIVATFDVGQNQMWCAQGWQMKLGQRILTSGGLGCMGYSLPAAIGAAIAGRRAWAFVGDGGLQMNLQELQTVVRLQLPIALFVLNNHSLGMIREGQWRYHESRFIGTESEYSVPDLEKVAAAFGWSYMRYDGVKCIARIQASPIMIEISLTQRLTRAFTKFDLLGR